MKRHARITILALAVVGLLASSASLYVHYRVLKDPTYTSFCDISETVSCEVLYQSAYGSVFGVPVAVGGVIWAALVLLLAWRGMGSSTSPTSGAIAGYIFALSTIGLAVVIYLGYASFVVIQKVCPLCITMYAAVVGIFVVSGVAAAGSLGMLPARAAGDIRGLTKSATATTLAILWLVGSGSLIAFFPRETGQGSGDQASADASVPIETLTAEAVAQFENWMASQSRFDIPVPADGAQVIVVKFNDYQCPACRQTYTQYKGIIAKYRQTFPGRVKFVTLDFPLDSECNTGHVHAAACEAAAAVRMARAKNRGDAMEEWLFANQTTMTPESVKEGVREIAQVTDFDAQYPKTLEQVRADADLGRKLGVTGTPAFFINGIRFQGGLRPAYFDAAIAYELNKASKTPQS